MGLFNGKGLFWTMRLIAVTAFLVSGCATSKEKANYTLPKNESYQESNIAEVKLSEFILGPGDELEITVWRHDDMNQTIQVSSSGYITYPLVGDIKAAGLSLNEVKTQIRDKLFSYFVNPQINIKVRGSRSQKIFVLGEVHRQGVFQIAGSMDAIEAITLAGGFTNSAKPETVLLVRGNLNKPFLRKINLKKTLRKADMSENVILQRGDILYVPATVIASVDRFFAHISNVITPAVMLEQGVVLAPLVKEVLTE